ncbi:uncharacterized protein ACA1_072680 [Acanthamoeba castellanii str. Neff]|uniref:Uncharacterized protein n=1 Tax=Acanthamoeba castellanii (strain ATCC 30010 / Neff) TaxID=1257118 RepID=L8HEQ8_ACACF|nr:uncharacterized protein ACA1_072680 [Acanthamoeba castellanii str. Neff]ELR23635.1 hypothetical protein ACA1_072680 [Acanthamoeba castellanii str. Neff]
MSICVRGTTNQKSTTTRGRKKRMEVATSSTTTTAWTHKAWHRLVHFLGEVRDRLLLTHVVTPNAPVWDIIKCGLVSIVVLLADKATKNPDHLSAVFTAFLCISPLTSSGFFIGLNIWIAAMIGTFIGTAVSAAAYIDPDDPDFFWWLIFKTPIAACLTMYALLVAKRYTPGDISSGLFSAIFVQARHPRVTPVTGADLQMILFEYEPMEDVKDTPRMLVLTTLIVRIIALTTAVLASTFVNFIASGWAVKSIFTARTYFAEAVIWESFSTLSTVPTSPEAQQTFGLLVGLLSDVRMARKEPYLTKGTKETLDQILKRLEHVFCLLSLQVMLCLLSDELVLSEEERRSLKQLLDTSHIRNLAQIDYAKAHPPEGAQPQEEEDHHAPHPIEPEDMPATVQLLARCLRFNLQELEQQKVNYRYRPNSIWWNWWFW